MKRFTVVLASILCAVSFAAVALAAEEKPATAPKKAAVEGKKPSVKKERTTFASATVEAIDQTTRSVTLKDVNGKMYDMVAGPQVKNLAQVKVGDVVDITFYESIAVKVFKPGEMPQAQGVAAGNERLAKPGEKPAGVVAATATVTATVESISPEKTSVTLKMSDGKYKVAKIENKKNLDNVKVGDEVMITITESLAIAVKPAKKK